jgi:hypothetical protein
MNCVEFLKEYDIHVRYPGKDGLSAEAATHLAKCETCSPLARKLQEAHGGNRHEVKPLPLRIRIKLYLIPLRAFCEGIDMWKVLCKSFPVLASGVVLGVLGALLIPDPLPFLLVLGSICLGFHVRAIFRSRSPRNDDVDEQSAQTSPVPRVSFIRLVRFAQGRLPPEETSRIVTLALAYPEISHDVELVTRVLKYIRFDEKKERLLALTSWN